jgi:GNAT superfamily N-acetyltransferase
VIRTAREEDLPVLQETERAAGRAFADIGMTTVADDEPLTLEVLRDFQRADRAWVHVDGDDIPAAYLLTEIIDGYAHIEQVSVHPDHARKGIGQALIDHLAQWARERKITAMTLTTFTNVPWNGPYYQRCGFRPLANTELTPGLRKIRADEIARGLDEWPRISMRREL